MTPEPDAPAAPQPDEACTRPGAEVAASLGIDPVVGLGDSEVAERRARFGANRLAEPPRRSKWLLFLDQFRAGIVYILAAAGLLAGLLGDMKDLIVIFVVLFINAVLGFFQENRASNALAALERMLVTRVRVRRSGATEEVAIDELVPGDVVLLEAGDRVPADGRLLFTANVSVDESSLTGESVPVDKHAEHVSAADSSLGDRLGMVFMNTTVVRGRAEMVVTATGMRTQMGRVADLLLTAPTTRTPLEHQLDSLSKRLAIVAGVAAVIVFITQWVIDDDFRTALLGAVALAVAAIPEGLPAVVTVTLAVGISKMASDNAIVKRLHSVETLGSTTVICSDKTGTLTLNQMTARKVATGGAVWSVSGEGYSPTGSIIADDGEVVDASTVLLPAALCSDAVLITDDEGLPGIIGDPTEGALVVVAAKAGLDAVELRARHPRVGEVPFDSATKFMATFSLLDPGAADGEVLICVKGAPDVVLARCTRTRGEGGVEVELTDVLRDERRDRNDELAAEGQRVLVLASRRVAAHEILADDGTVVDAESWVHSLCLDALVGIVDPPRSEARDAIALCHGAGIDVKMITGDHAVTAGAIARQLGIAGEVVTGDELDSIDDEQLRDRIGSIGVCARVSPEHKVRVVEALRARGEIVAMTGDGVNDAAALRRADIGVAMGITGTEVSKEAADMVLTDDNFATIAKAVERGRVVYDNILKFIRFQLTTAFGAVFTILGSSIAAVHVPFTALQVLWVNLIADGPTAITLGIDKPAPGVMDREPEEPGSAILDRPRLVRLLFQGLVTAVGVLVLYVWSIDHFGETTGPGAENPVAMTMAFTAFVVAQLVNVFSARSETETVFARYTFRNGWLWASVIGVLLLQIGITEVPFMESLFDTQALTFAQWMLCFLPALLLLVSVEIWKAVGRARRRTADVR